MTTLRFNLPVEGDFDAAVVEQTANILKDALESEPEIGEPMVKPLGAGRSVAGITAAIALAIPLIAEGAKAVGAIWDVIERLRKLSSTPEGTKQLLAKVNPKDLLVDVDGVLVPLPELTDEHLKTIRDQA